MLSIALECESADDAPLTSRERARKQALARYIEQETLEREADALLRAIPADPECPTYTEEQLLRPDRGGRFGRTSVQFEMMEEAIPAPRATQSWKEELEFLASIAHLTLHERSCLQSWMLGLTQDEIGDRMGLRHQQTVSLTLRSAARKCYEEGLGVSFSQFSTHPAYRKPIHRKGFSGGRVCRNCEEPFAHFFGSGVCCSTGCREMMTRRRREE